MTVRNAAMIIFVCVGDGNLVAVPAHFLLENPRIKQCATALTVGQEWDSD